MTSEGKKVKHKRRASKAKKLKQTYIRLINFLRTGRMKFLRTEKLIFLRTKLMNFLRPDTREKTRLRRLRKDVKFFQTEKRKLEEWSEDLEIWQDDLEKVKTDNVITTQLNLTLKDKLKERENELGEWEDLLKKKQREN